MQFIVVFCIVLAQQSTKCIHVTLITSGELGHNYKLRVIWIYVA